MTMFLEVKPLTFKGFSKVLIGLFETTTTRGRPKTTQFSVDLYMLDYWCVFPLQNLSDMKLSIKT